MEKDKVFVQTHRCSSYDVTSIVTCDREVISGETDPILHRQARFIIVCEGSGQINIQGRIYNIKEGSLVCILPYQYSKIVNVDQKLVYNIIIFNFDLFNELIKSHLNFFNEELSLIELFAQNNVVNCDAKTFKQNCNIFDNLRQELGIESTKSRKESTNKFSSVFISSQILQLVCNFTKQAKEISNKEKDSLEYDQIFQYIYLNLSQNLTLEDLSNIFYISPSSIGEYIRKLTGYSFSDLLMEMRLARVENFLLYTNLSLKEISNILNFSDFSYISKIFSSKRNYKASEFRNVYKKINKISKIKDNPVAYKIVDFIYDNSDKNLNASDVAEKFDISEQELNYQLKYLVEKNYNCFINYIRINKSIRLLLDGDESIAEISKRVGYDSVRTYNRNFKKFYNANPNKFRKNIKIEDWGVMKT